MCTNVCVLVGKRTQNYSNYEWFYNLVTLGWIYSDRLSLLFEKFWQLERSLTLCRAGKGQCGGFPACIVSVYVGSSWCYDCLVVCCRCCLLQFGNSLMLVFYYFGSNCWSVYLLFLVTLTPWARLCVWLKTSLHSYLFCLYILKWYFL